MKKSLLLLVPFLFVICFSNISNATLFTIGDGGSLFFGGFGGGSYSVDAIARSFNLDEGKISGPLDFFRVNVTSPLAGGLGTVDAAIQMTAPADEYLTDQGDYLGLSVQGTGAACLV